MVESHTGLCWGPWLLLSLSFCTNLRPGVPKLSKNIGAKGTAALALAKESVLEAHLIQKYNATPTPQIHAPPPRYLGRCCSLVKKISARFERNVSL